MANARATETWQNLVIELSDEPGVRLSADGLTVNGNLFAFPAADELVVDLSSARAADLVHRGMAARYKHDGVKSRDWVTVSDLSLWAELAREAHEYVGEPPVGGQS
jgi:hypothetical protein